VKEEEQKNLCFFYLVVVDEQRIFFFRSTTSKPRRRIFTRTYVQLFPMCDSCLKGKKIVGKPKKYEFKEDKEKIVFLGNVFVCM